MHTLNDRFFMIFPLPMVLDQKVIVFVGVEAVTGGSQGEVALEG